MDNESALLLEPYSDVPGYHGEAGWQQDALDKAVESVNRRGLLAHLHAIGDGGVRMALNAIEHAERSIPDDRERNAITHLQLVSDDDVPRFAELNVTAVADPVLVRQNAPVLGAEGEDGRWESELRRCIP